MACMEVDRSTLAHNSSRDDLPTGRKTLMNDKVLTKKSVYAEEQLEILDSGVHLGWADVVEGKWTFSPPSLDVKQYQLTAKYKDKVSAPWAITVGEAPHTDDFKSAETGGFTRITRPYYEGNVTLIGDLAPNVRGGFVATLPDDSSGQYLYVRAFSTDISVDKYSTVFDMVFHEAYSIVQLRTHVSNEYEHMVDASVHALDERGQAVDTHIFPRDAYETLTFGVAGSTSIKSLSFRLMIPDSIDANGRVSVFMVTMIK